ncbi:MAG: serine/threonine protein kinase [Polyangiaceae bacterium]|nr:serine/threonine protein kinase [Polyangiaceae bacterium]
MSFWERWKGKGSAEPPPAPPPPAAAPPAPRPEPRVERSLLGALAAGDPVDERAVLDELGRARGTAAEKPALAAVEAAAERGLASEALRTRAAEIALARGEPERALGLLTEAAGPAALLLAADACAETGAVARALTLVERVLARDIDAPGARERHERWRRALGERTPAAVSALNEPTLIRADAPETALRIVGEAGRGGAGTVFEAVDDALARRVALKIYHRPERERDKLAREARTAVALAGSGVVRVYDVDLDHGSLVMEWLAAGSLKQAIVRRDTELLFPVERWLLPLARTLARVHQAGWVHADLKPANVMFRAPGQPVLSDFGLAHRGARVVEGGSVGYMSPARVRGEAVSFAEDLYGFGRLVEDVLALGDAPERLRRLVARLLAADPGLPDAGGLVALVAGPA